MSDINPLFPRQPVPSLSVSLVGGGTWTLSEQQPENFTMLVFYRGLHCPVCAKYLGDLNRRVDDFSGKGVTAIAISGDGEDRATRARDDWKLDKLSMGYGMTLDQARQWGLYISGGIGVTSIGIEEPSMFFEPGLFMVRPDGTLYFGSVQTMPFARPHFAEIAGALDFILGRDYPARGEIINHTA